MDNSMLEYLKKHRDKKNKNLKYDFMPSLLEIIERPAHKAGSVIIWTIFLFFIVVIIWAYVSKVDVVITEKGKIESVQNPEIITTKGMYQIVSVNVEEGQKVKKGELLIELCADEQKKEQEEVERQKKSTEGYIALYQTILKAKGVEQLDLSLYEKIDKIEMEEQIEKYNSHKKMLDQYKKSGFKSQANELNKEYKKEMQQYLIEKEEELKEIDEKITKLTEQIKNAKVYAPYDCVIYKLYVEKENVIVTEKQPLFALVNSNEDMEFQCYVENSNVAEIKPNQIVKLKLDAYPYSRYGTIEGKVTDIGQKVLEQEMSGMVLIKVAITDEKFDRELFIGMTGSADMIISKRRIINYFLEPITGALQDCMKEN